MGIRDSAVIILGASGNLAQKKLIPALKELYQKGEIHPSTTILGNGRTEFSNRAFREALNVPQELAGSFYYHRGISGLKESLESLGKFKQYIFFMALPPLVYEATAEALYREGFRENTRLIVEKPFGRDYKTARDLNRKLLKYYDESQIYRIDHYLAKEAVQNILTFRFANTLFYPVWNSGSIDSIEITALEEIGIENRGAYFDESGIIRDMVQNHLIQLLALLTMEAPVSLNAEDIRNQKINILKVLEYKRCYRHQYTGYSLEKGVKKGSHTETYAELELRINNFRWSNTPIYIRTGKATGRRGTEIAVVFKAVPPLLFNEQGALKRNAIIFRIQPGAGIAIDHSIKVPGNSFNITTSTMELCYEDTFSGNIPEAYQRLLLDVLKGDRSLFVSGREVELSWQKIEPVLERGDLQFYKPGTLPNTCLGVEWYDIPASRCLLQPPPRRSVAQDAP